MSKIHHECYSQHRKLYIHKQCGIVFILNHHLYVDNSQICVSESDVFLTFSMLNQPVPFHLMSSSAVVNGTSTPKSSKQESLASPFTHHSPLFLLLKCLWYSSFLFNLYLYHYILLLIYHVCLQQLLMKYIPGATTFFRQWRY